MLSLMYSNIAEVTEAPEPSGMCLRGESSVTAVVT